MSNDLPPVGSTLRRALGGAHKPQVLHVRGLVDGRLVLREWVGGRWSYSVQNPSWWMVNRRYITVEHADDRPA